MTLTAMTRKLTLRQKREIESWLFKLPWVLGFLLFLAYPIAYSLVLSFSKVNQMSLEMRFIGLKNYARAFLVDTRFLPLYAETIGNTLIDTPIIMFFSLVVAIMLNKQAKMRGLFRALFFLPFVISSGYVIQELFGQGVGGLSVALGTEAESGFSGASMGAEVLTAKTPSVVNVTGFVEEFVGPDLASAVNSFLNRLGLVLWRSGIQILLFLAGLQGISASIYDAAKIDGASEWQLFWKVTLPVISPIVMAVIIFTIVDSFMDVFNQVLSYIHQIAFTAEGGFDFGYSAAVSWIYFLTVLSVILGVSFALRKRIFYQGAK